MSDLPAAAAAAADGETLDVLSPLADRLSLALANWQASASLSGRTYAVRTTRAVNRFIPAWQDGERCGVTTPAVGLAPKPPWHVTKVINSRIVL